ncbi:MFS transporter [Cuneatibacter sp. NSJ-177]|jgi:GPH family glycoside/pentoside/hexuronide:cation symporter|uniref:MFS transporter n=1 Tax=Cuneatibacter sp. NSJ-177 TaxID=2931401 RepID=UPI001FD17DA0|nr:MFS transporter [Cuneatibacter sp. NSJ-177]MCJ7836612.1 MFS transporter [Cuneatibacter sp. NSJ-177]
MENKVQRAMPTLKKSQLLMYGFGGMFLNTFYLMFLAYYRLFFLTNVLMLDTYVAATINSISVWINVGTMVLAGIIVDSTNLKWGKFRSWVPIGGVMVTIAFPLMFANLGLSTGAAAVMFVVMFAIQSIGYNTLWVAERSLVGPMSRNTADATALATYAQQGSTIGGFIYGLVGTRILAFWGTGPNSYALTGLTFGLFILAGTFLIFFMTKKYDLPSEAKPASAPKAEKVGLGQMLKSIRGPMIPFVVAMILNNCHLGFFMTLLNHFTTYVLNDPEVLGLAVTLGSVASFVGAWISKIMCDRMGKRSAFIWFSLLTGVLYMLIAFIGRTSVPFLILRLCVGASCVVGGMLIPAFANDLADYNEMKGTSNARAFVQALSGTTIRMGTALSTMIASFGLAFVGFQAGMEPTPQVVNGITYMMAFGPAIVCVLSALCFIPYHVDEKELDAYRAEKAAKMAK